MAGYGAYYSTMGPGGKPVYSFGSSLGAKQDAQALNGYSDPSVGQALTDQGYEYNPTTGQWGRTPTDAGTRANQYTNAAMGGSLQALLSQFGGGAIPGMGGGSLSGGGGTAPGFQGGPTTGGGGTSGVPSITPPSQIAPVAPVDTTAQNAAIFSRAKDTAGSLARSSLNSLNGELGASGMIGSGAQVQGTRDVVQAGAGMLADVNRQNAINDAQSASDLAKFNYTGQLTQRGQDINQQGMGYTGAITMRGQDIQEREAAAQLASANTDRYLRLLQSMMSMYGGGGSSAGSAYLA